VSEDIDTRKYYLYYRLQNEELELDKKFREDILGTNHVYGSTILSGFDWDKTIWVKVNEEQLLLFKLRYQSAYISSIVYE
jgi:hypothetical protein